MTFGIPKRRTTWESPKGNDHRKVGTTPTQVRSEPVSGMGTGLAPLEVEIFRKKLIP